MPHMERVKLLLRRAKRFLRDAEQALEDRYYDIAIFYAEQAARLGLKALVLKTIGYYPEIHGLRELLGIYYSVSHDEEAAELAKHARRILALLERAYTEARYGSEEYTEEEAREALAVAQKLLELITERLGELSN